MPKKHVAGSTVPNKPATKPERENRDPNGLNSHIKVSATITNVLISSSNCILRKLYTIIAR